MNIEFNFGKEFVKGRWRLHSRQIFSGAKAMCTKFHYFVLQGLKVKLLNVSVYLNGCIDTAMLSKTTLRDLYISHAYLCFLIKFATGINSLSGAQKALSEPFINIEVSTK